MSKERQKTGEKEEGKAVQRKFPYQLEFCPNQDCIQIHARSRFPYNEDSGLDLRWIVKYRKKKEGKKTHPLYLALAKIQGLETASAAGNGYSLQIIKARMFSWDELLPKILKVVQETVAGKRQLLEVGKKDEAATKLPK